MRIVLQQFGGMIPKMSDRDLPDHSARTAQNAKLWSGDLVPFRNPLDIEAASKSGTIKTIYPLGAFWLNWTQDVNVAKGIVAGDTSDRIYYTGHNQPKATNLSLATSAGSEYPVAWYKLGLPPPDTAPTVGHTGGSTGSETRSYVYTFVTAWGEEGPPSDPTEHTTFTDATSWDISGMDVAPPNSGTFTSASFGASTATLDASASHFLETGDYITIASVTGTGACTTDLVGTWKVTRVDVDTVTIPVATSGTLTSCGYTREAPIQTTGMVKYIYRTDSAGTFRFVAEVAVATTTYADSIANADLSSTELPSATWSSPPSDLTALIALPNEMYAGISGNQVCFSVPGHVHAWPEDYRHTLPVTPIALGFWGGTVVVGTDEKPRLFVGAHPDNMSETTLDYDQSCVSKRGMISFATGVMYPSPNGLVFVGSGGVRVLTKTMFRRDDWQVYNPSSFHAVPYDDRYVAFFSGAGDGGDESGALIIDAEESLASLSLLTINASASYHDSGNDIPYVVADGVIRKLDSGGSEEQVFWASKTFVTHRPCNFGAIKCEMKATADITAAEREAALSASKDTITSLYRWPTHVMTETLKQGGGFGGFSPGRFAVASGPYDSAASRIPSSGTRVTIRLLAKSDNTDTELEQVYSKTITTSSVLRPPGGFKSTQWQIQISARNAVIHSLTLAETLRELSRSQE